MALSSYEPLVVDMVSCHVVPEYGGDRTNHMGICTIHVGVYTIHGGVYTIHVG